MNNNVTIVCNVLGMLGIPSIFAMTIYCIKQCSKFANQLKILHSAQKAQMRSQLLEQYYVIKERSFVWSDELDDWMNQYKAYHELVGDNGVLDARKKELENYPSKQR